MDVGADDGACGWMSVTVGGRGGLCERCVLTTLTEQVLEVLPADVIRELGGLSACVLATGRLSTHVGDEDLGTTTHGSTTVSTAKTAAASKAGAKSTTETTTGSAHATTATASVEAGLGLAILRRRVSFARNLSLEDRSDIPRERR